MSDKTVTLNIEYEILYNIDKLIKEMEYVKEDADGIIAHSVTVACYDSSKKIYTDYSDFYGIDDVISDVKNHNCEKNNMEYSCYENRTITVEVTYDNSKINNIEKSVKIFQFNGDAEMVTEFDSNIFGRIETIAVNDYNIRQINRTIKNKIINLLEGQNKKIPVSDINAFLKHKNLDEIKFRASSESILVNLEFFNIALVL